MTDEISRDLLGKIVDEVFDGGLEDASVIEDIYRVIKREEALAPSPVAKALEEIEREIERRAGTAYCRSLDKFSSTPCLGFDAKVKCGKFTDVEHAAHKEANLLMGRHQGLAEAISIILDLRSALATPDDGWMTMESAPKDGHHFLAYCEDTVDEYDEDRLLRRGVKERYTVVAYWLWGQFVQFPFTGSIVQNLVFTHWRHLPASPANWRGE